MDPRSRGDDKGYSNEPLEQVHDRISKNDPVGPASLDYLRIMGYGDIVLDIANNRPQEALANLGSIDYRHW